MADAELNELLWALPSTLDPHQIVAVLLERGARLFDAPLAAVWFREGASYELAGAFGFTEKKAEQLWQRLELADKPPRPVAMQGAELHALSAFGKRRLGALLAVPMQTPNGLTGWLALARFDPRPFSELEQQFISVLIARVSLAIENARHYQETETRSRELELLYEIAQLLVSTIRLDELLDRLVVRMTETFDLSGSAIRLLDPETGQLPMRAIHYRDPEQDARLKAYFAQRPHPAGHGRTGLVLKLARPYVTRNILEDPIFDAADRKAIGPGSMIVVPLFVRGKAIGVLIWFRAGRQRPLGETLVPLVQHLATQVAIAIEHAQLYQEMEAQVAERTALLRASNEALSERLAEGRATIGRFGEGLRSQLHNVLGYSGLLQHALEQRGALAPQEQDFLDKLMASAEAVHELVDDLMTWLKQAGQD
jgi:GAF domain-containing protein